MMLLSIVPFIILLWMVEGEVGTQCVHKEVDSLEFQPEVYYINMDKSLARKIAIEKHLAELKLRSFRVRGITPDEIFIPKDLLQTWETKWCLTESEIPLPDHLNISTSLFTGINEVTKKPYTTIMRGLCGRKRNDNKNTGNQIKELGCEYY